MVTCNLSTLLLLPWIWIEIDDFVHFAKVNNANKKVIKKNCAFNVASTHVEESVKVKKIVARLSIDFIYYYLIKWHSVSRFGLPNPSSRKNIVEYKRRQRVTIAIDIDITIHIQFNWVSHRIWIFTTDQPNGFATNFHYVNQIRLLRRFLSKRIL